MTSETPGWYHAELDPLGTKRYWDGDSWSFERMGGNIVMPRLFAKIIDSLIVGVPVIVVARLFLGVTKVTFGVLLLSIFFTAIYEIGFVTMKGATPGKELLGFKIVETANGQSPPRLSTAVRRIGPNLIGAFPFIGFFLGWGVVGLSLYWLTSDPDRKSAFDRSGGTFVVRTVN